MTGRITQILERLRPFVNENGYMPHGEEEEPFHHDVIDILHAVAKGECSPEEGKEMMAQAIENHNPTLSHIDAIMDGIGDHNALMGESYKKKTGKNLSAKRVNEVTSRTKKVLTGIGAAGLGAAALHPSVHHALAHYMTTHPHALDFDQNIRHGLAEVKRAKEHVGNFLNNR